MSLGERIADLRARRGMSQRELASAVGRSESWVSQVERDVLHVERIPVLQALADALDVSLRDLQETAEPEERGRRPPSPLESLRLAMTGHPAPETLFQHPHASRSHHLDDLDLRVAVSWADLHASRFDALSTALVELLPAIEAARRQAPAKTRQRLNELTAQTYQIASAAFARLDEADASWVAADRALFIAETSKQPLGVMAGLFRMTHAFVTLQQLGQAAHAAQSGIDALSQTDPKVPEAIAMLGALYLALSVVHARGGERDQAERAIQKARGLAERLGVDRNDFGTEFGPTNVQLHAVAVAVELGDAGLALTIANTVDPTVLSPERQSRYWIDVARAHAQRRHTGDAIAALVNAERAAPEQLRTHALARLLIRDLMALSGRRVPDELTALASRCGV